MKWFALWSGVAALAAGCQQAPATRVEAGASAYRFVEREAPKMRAAPRGPSEVTQPVEAFEAARPIEPLALPVYPVAARGRQRVPTTVGVRITVSVDGTVSQVGHSPLVLSLPSEFSAEFRAAVEEAVAQWRFVPAQLQQLVPKGVGTGREYWQVTRVEKTEQALDVEFTFTASGDVLRGAR